MADSDPHIQLPDVKTQPKRRRKRTGRPLWRETWVLVTVAGSVAVAILLTVLMVLVGDSKSPTKQKTVAVAKVGEGPQIPQSLKPGKQTVEERRRELQRLAAEHNMKVLEGRATSSANIGQKPTDFKDFASLFEWAVPSVVFVVVEGADGVSQGSGFIVDNPQRVIITNEHVVRGGSRIRVALRDTEFSDVKVIRIDRQRDLAALSLPIKWQNRRGLGLSTSRARTGNPVVVISNPAGGFSFSFSDGHLSGIALVDGVQHIQHTASISPGSSGSPLLQEDGSVLAVNVGGISKANDIYFAISASEVLTFLSKPVVFNDGPAGNHIAERKGLAVQYLTRGNKFFQEKKYDAAIADYTKAMNIDPTNATAHYSRGVSYYMKRQYDQAITDYTNAISFDKTFMMAYYGRGSAYYYKGSYDQAIMDYTNAISLDPTHANAYVARSAAYDKKGDRVNTESDLSFAKSLGYKPGNN